MRDAYDNTRKAIHAFKNAGCDYCTVRGSAFRFPVKDITYKSTISLNDAWVIGDEESYDAYVWPNPEDFDFNEIETWDLPEDMKWLWHTTFLWHGSMCPSYKGRQYPGRGVAISFEITDFGGGCLMTRLV